MWIAPYRPCRRLAGISYYTNGFYGLAQTTRIYTALSFYICVPTFLIAPRSILCTWMGCPKAKHHSTTPKSRLDPSGKGEEAIHPCSSLKSTQACRPATGAGVVGRLHSWSRAIWNHITRTPEVARHGTHQPVYHELTYTPDCCIVCFGLVSERRGVFRPRRQSQAVPIWWPLVIEAVVV